MATYIIGDVQGCYTELRRLLDHIHFDPSCDQLGFVGDLVNRGPDSLETLRFIKNLPNPLIVLGNHDLYLMAIGSGAVVYRGEHTLQQVLAAPDLPELLDWLRRQPLAIYLSQADSIIVHAGVPPRWSLADLLKYAKQASSALQGPGWVDFLRDLEFHRHDPLQWSHELDETARLQYIVHALTRMRFCTADGKLDMVNKTAKSSDAELFKPWYDWYRLPHRVLFGHWAALEGRQVNPLCEALDTGCVWGRELTAYRVEDGRRFSVPAKK